MSDSARQVFDILLERTLIPAFVSDASRGMTAASFRSETNKVTERDALDFLRGWHSGLAEHQGRGQYLFGDAHIKEQFFTSGTKAKIPRPYTLWLEPIITLGAITRLHLDYGWPASHLTAQSSDYAFDIMANDHVSLSIAGEVKKSAKEVEDLIRLMTEYGLDPERVEPSPQKEQNAFRKAKSLRENDANLLWIVGPDRLEHVFHVSRSDNGETVLTPGSPSDLRYSHVPAA